MCVWGGGGGGNAQKREKWRHTESLERGTDKYIYRERGGGGERGRTRTRKLYFPRIVV